MQATRFLERALLVPQFFRQRADDLSRNEGRFSNRCKMLMHRFYGPLSTKAATGACEGMPRESFNVEWYGWRKKDVQDITERGILATGTWADLRDIAPFRNQPFRQKESASQLIVV